MRLSLSKAWEDCRRIFAGDGSLLTAIALALLVLPQIVTGVVTPSMNSTPSLGGRVVDLLAALIGVIGQLAIVRLALGPSTTVADAIRHGMRRFPAVFGALILLMVGLFVILVPVVAVLIGAGMIQVPAPGEQPGGAFTTVALLLGIACVLIAVRFMLTVPIASAEEAGPLTILKRSWRLSSGHYGRLLGLELLLLVAAIVLLLTAQIVGGLVAEMIGGDITPFSLSALVFAIVVARAQAAFTVLASVMLARVYVQLGGGGAEVSVPSSGT